MRISIDEWWIANVPADFWEHIEWPQILRQLAYDVAAGLVEPPAERPVYNDGVREG